ncbi:proteoglycan 4-like isoform X2 [Anoplophora glabripennis]|uniref:proteoglycan 4-like isoform X2 n=1 Tax=Anoplophora glabripennis TaxID=217634 RepID=UPI000873DEF1|nr:proteoglycan 4-like isoform X2 [Anoplophora glabripennis]
MQPPRQAGLQKPTPSGMQPPRPAGLQRPTPSGMQPPRPTGVSRMVTPQNLPRPTGLRAPGTTGRQMKPALEAPTSPVREPSPREPQIPPQRESPEDRANRSLAEKSMARMGEKVTARAASMSPCAPKYIDTPEGTEMVLKETVFKTRVERDEEGEKIVKNLQIMDAQTGGMPKMIEMNLQQLDPRYALKEGKEVISIASKLSMSESYTTVTHDVSRAVTETVPEAAGMPTEEIAKLVEEENEDVDNTLKMLPPDLALSPGRYEMKRRLQHLQLNSESVALLEQSIIHPQPRADEAQTEPTPEVMAAMMHTVEKGVPPLSTPDQVFNTLFMETSNERYIKLSPVTEGPLQDVVVPTEVPLDVHKEVITDDMEKLTEKLQNIPTAAELPELDIFEQVMAQGNQITAKGGKNIAFQPITDEKSLWVNANLEHLVYVVGAVPVEVLDPANVDALEATGQLEAQMETGVEYYVDADPVQYMSRVQLRGTQLPSYFPGYLVALPEFPDVVKLASCPDEVFASAWKSAQPKYFPDESMQSMIF